MASGSTKNISPYTSTEVFSAAAAPIPRACPIARRDLTDGGTGVYLSARALLVFVFLVLIFTVAARQIVDPDFWWHLKTGQHLVETRSIPHTDIFSTEFFGKEWIT